MRHTDELHAYCNVLINVCDKDGNVVRKERLHNLVTNAGLNLIRDWYLDSGTKKTISHFGIGDGSANALPTDTWLGSAKKYVPMANCIKVEDTGRVRIYYVLPMTDLNGNTIREVALLTGNASAGNVCYARARHADIPKTIDYQIAYLWECVWGYP